MRGAEIMSSSLFNITWRAAILIIGNEILIGRVLDTNSQKLARLLTLSGYNVIEIRKVRDDIEDIAKALRELMFDVNVIVTTGGLGPTYDDITAEALAYAIGSPLCIKEGALDLVKNKLEEMGLKLDENRKKMAIMPCIAVPIPNPVGVAPGIAVFMPRVKIFSLPGVPREMEVMFEKYILPILEKDSLYVRAEECDVLEGIREADIAPIIKQYAKEHPDSYIKTHPGVKDDGSSFVKICVMTSAPDKEEAAKKAHSLLKSLISRIRREKER